MRNLLPGSAPISLQWFSLYLSFSIICKATTVTHTKRIDHNLLRKEPSFVCYTSSVLRKSRHMRQKKKLRTVTVAKIKTQDYKNWRLHNFFTIVTPPLNTATTLFNEHRSQRPLGTSDWQNILIAFRVVFVSGDQCSLNSVVAVFSGGVTIVKKFCNLQFL